MPIVGERVRDDVGERPLRGGLVVFVAVDQHRRERSMPGEMPNLIEPDTGGYADCGTRNAG
jgi:hypothetical protein